MDNQVDKAKLMSFGEALEKAKQGLKIARLGWNGKGLFVYYMPQTVRKVQCAAEVHLNKIVPLGVVTEKERLLIKCDDNTVAPWVPSINDTLGLDWYAVED